MSSSTARSSQSGYAPYLPLLVQQWARMSPDLRRRELEGSLVSVDISGFTSLSERLAAKGRAGAEELILLISGVYEGLIRIAARHGGDVLKFRGDALLILFDGAAHEARACVAADAMQWLIDETGRTGSSVGPVELTMSTGIFSGSCHFFLVDSSHRELIVTGPAATETIRLEDGAGAREILISRATADALDPSWLGPERDGARLLRRGLPEILAHAAVEPADHGEVDLAPFLPQSLRATLGSAAVEPEHRQATAAFLKFSGVDAVLTEGGIDALGERLEALAEVVGKTVDDLGVTWLESDIDVDAGKLYLTAGAPVSQGGDEERMLRALRRILDEDYGLTLRAGVNRGNVFAGEIGSSFRRTYAVMGDTVNLAARLAGRAQPGQILATGEVLDRSQTRFESQAQPFLVKGKERAVTAYSVGELLGAREELQLELLPLLGRDAELATLRSALDAARMRQNRLVELVGEPGIGKSRLVEELTTLAVGFTQLVARCEAYATAAPYFVFRPLLRQLAGIVPTAGSQAAGEHLVAWVQGVMPDLTPWLPLLAIPFDASAASSPEVDSIDPSFRRQRLHEVVEQFLERVLMMPTLLVFEDTHWMDDASRELLLHLTGRPAPRPWLVCTTRRLTGTPIVAEESPHATSLSLDPLDANAATALALAAGEHLSLSDEVLSTLTERSGGNPLFVRELVAASKGGEAGDLPETVERLMTERIDMLEPDDRLLLRYAAVVGARFDLELLREILEPELAGVGDLARWERLGDFVERQGDDTLRFRHDLFRGAAYEGLSFKRRREIHGRVGAALERRAGNRADEAAGLLSLHFLEAEDPERAWRYSVVAGRRAQARFANVDAAEFYERALRASEGLATPDAVETAMVAESLGDVCELAARYEEAGDAYRRARGLVDGDLIAETRLLRKEGILLERLGRYDEALKWYARALAAIEEQQLGPELETDRVELELEYAVVLYRQGQFEECFRWSERAAAHAEEIGDRKTLAHAYRLLDSADRGLGGLDSRYLELALPIYEEIGDLLGKAIVLNNLGVRAYFGGRWEEAMTRYAESREAEHGAGDVVRAASASNNEAEILLDQGHLERAAELFAEALRVYRAAAYTFGAGVAIMNLGRIAAAAGRFQEAHRRFDEALAEFRGIGAESFVLEANMRRAECFVLEGRYTEAWELATETLTAAELAGEATPRVPLLERVRGYARVQGRKPDEAGAHFEESRRVAEQLGAEYELALTMKALADTGAPQYAGLAQVIFDRLGVVATPHVPLP